MKSELNSKFSEEMKPIPSPVRAVLAGSWEVFKRPRRIFSAGRLGVLWYLAYFGSQQRTQDSRSSLTDTALDERIPIDEEGIYPYLFACVYLPGSIFHFLSLLGDDNYTIAIHAYEKMILDAKRTFIACPTRISTRHLIKHPLTKLFHLIDGPTNCFPSLHVALVVLTYHIFKLKESDPLSMLPAARQSCIDICRSTLKTRQHSVVDVIGGLVLAERTYESFFNHKSENLL